MALFTAVVVVQLLLPGELGYYRWAGIFAPQWMKFLTFVVIVALALHAWVGVRDIWMDYIKPVGLRLALQVLSIVWLVGCAGWAVQVLWRL
jgi:succinate dehydrogenase / fumarate reductase membrane anchor subunit